MVRSAHMRARLACGSRPGSPDDSPRSGPDLPASVARAPGISGRPAAPMPATLPRWTSRCARSPRASSPISGVRSGLRSGASPATTTSPGGRGLERRPHASPASTATTIVATAAAFSFELTVPGHALVPTAGVTMVGVHPTHRRRGLLVRMMEEQLADVAARVRAARGAHRERVGDLRTIRVRPRHVLVLLDAPDRGHDVRPAEHRGGQFRLLDPADRARPSCLRSTTRRASGTSAR